MIAFFCGFMLIYNGIVLAINLLTNALPSLLSTLIMPRKILKTEAWGKHRVNSESVVGNTNDVQISVTDKLRSTLSDEQKFEQFVQWMYGEFSSETILAFIELVQFKEFMMNEIKNEGVECKWRFYENIPKSSIISSLKTKEIAQTGVENQRDNEYRKIAHRLYAKYIKIGTELEVNISALLRDKYEDLDDNNWQIEINELHNTFDEVIEEMFMLMLQSFVRFESSL